MIFCDMNHEQTLIFILSSFKKTEQSVSFTVMLLKYEIFCLKEIFNNKSSFQNSVLASNSRSILNKLDSNEFFVQYLFINT